MPSEKALQAKQEAVAQLKSKLDGAVAGVLVDYRGITVADDTKLRRELREAGIDYSVVKNTLLRRALEGTEYSEMVSVLENTTAFAVSHEDPVAAAKILCKFCGGFQRYFRDQIIGLCGRKGIGCPRCNRTGEAAFQRTAARSAAQRAQRQH